MLVTLAEVVKDFERRWDSWDWVCTNLVNPQVSCFGAKALCEVANLFSLWGGGDQVDETSRMPDTYSGVQGEHTVVVQFDLSECAHSFELISLWSCDLFDLQMCCAL